MNSWDFMLKGIDLQGLVIMDAGTGAANTTHWLATKLNEAGSGKIISIDNDPETFPDAKGKLGDLARLVEFVEADLTNMPQIKSESIDLIICHATICAVIDRPLKAVKALTEFYRVLKKDSWLVIDDEYPLPKASKPEEQVQVKRWQTYKAMAELVDGEHYAEIHPEELEFTVKFAGFRDVEWKKFDGPQLSEEVMIEWKEEMPKIIDNIGDEDLKASFKKAVGKIWEMYASQGGIFPPYYVMRAHKR